MEAKLRVVKGPFSGRTIRLPQGKLLIGREKDCQLRLDSNSVSRHHCVLLLDEYALRIRDLGSKNGTIVNGSRIDRESILQHDDTVSIDQLIFEIDLGKSAHDVIIAGAEAQPAVSQNALADTGMIDGDTGQSVPADTRTDTVPNDRARHISPRAPSQDGPSAAEAAPAERAAALLQEAAPVGSERRGPTSTSSTASSSHATPPKGERKAVAGPVTAPPKQVEQPPAKPKPIVKPKQDAAGKVGRSARKSRGSGVRRKMAIAGAGLIALVGLFGGGAFLLRGPSQGTPYAVPQNYVLLNPKSYASMLSCEVPQDWKQDIRGGQNIGPIEARFTDGRLSIEICEKLTGSGIRETAVAMRQKAESARHDQSLAELIHEHQRQQSSDKFKSFSEDPRSRGIKTKGYGECQISDFTATEGILGTEVRGCRATVLNPLRQFTVICKCPPAIFPDAKPVFEKVISTLNCGVVAQQ
jgi:FHA domain